MAALSAKVIQNAFLAQDGPRTRHNPRYTCDFCALNTRSMHSVQGCRLSLADTSAKWLNTTSTAWISFGKQGNISCNATQGASDVLSIDKVDFLKLQNGSNCFQNAITHGITAAGHDVLQFGLASTPAMFNSTLTEDAINHCPADGGIMITASHLPYNRNGFKFFTSDGGLNKTDIKDILERASKVYEESAHCGKQEQTGVVTHVDYMSIYASDLVQAVRKSAGNKEKPLEGLHIVVDAGNGAGGFFVDKDKAAMEAITQAVLNNKADLGIIFDTDVDSGRELNRNRLIALMSAIVLEEHPGTTVVTDSVTSDGLTAFIEKKLGGKHHRFKRGYKNVIDEAIRLNSTGEESHLAMETSGHGALKENHWLDDGAYTMVKLLNKLAGARTLNPNIGSKVLTDLVEGLEEAAVTVEIRLKIDQNHADLKGGSFRDYGESILKHLESVISKDPNLNKAPKNHEGVRVSGYGGWFMLRLSLHDPVLPLNIEAQSKNDAMKLGLAVLAAASEFSALDTTALNKFLQQ
ncbi:unnamed protein product [Triticum turgidum subsp. durum]|uniref:Phosphoglucomutase n=1 Tax=Triticum turgidum subsp. durum TaxID=4567 RepID=A0A9R1AIB7_TRITD|nr:unnamed protein product [Triticum turgidum subsp. durum]